jgi:large conductance mechanosensitive channel
MKKNLEEFKAFINNGSLIDLAIAVVLATFFSPIVKAIVDGIVLNLVAAIFGKPNFDSIHVKIRTGDGPVALADGTVSDGNTYLEFGKVLTAVVTFLVVAVVCFLIIKAYNKMKPPVVAEEPGPTEVDLLTEIRDSLRNR